MFDELHDIELTPAILAFELSIDFSDQVIDECIRQNISHAELASILGVKPATLSEKLNGSNLTLKSMASIALALDCDMKAPLLIPQKQSSRAVYSDRKEIRVETKEDGLTNVFEDDFLEDTARVMYSPVAHADGKAYSNPSYSLDLKKEAA